MLAAMFGADARRHRPVARREPAGRGAARPRRLPFRQPPHPVPRRRPSSVLLATSFLSPRADPARGAGRVPGQPGAGRGDAVSSAPRSRARGAGWCILGVNIQPSEFLKPAFVDPDRLAVRANRRAGRRCRPTPSALALLLIGRDAAGAAARLRPDHADRAGLGRAVLHGRDAAHLGRSASPALAGVGLVGAYFTVPHVAQRIQRFLDPRLGRHLQHRHRAGIASRAAAGSAAARARAPSSASCRRATPTSSSRSAAEEFGIVLCLDAAWRCSPSS